MNSLFPAWLQQILSALHIELPENWLLILWAIILFTGIAVVGQAAVIFMVLMERKVLAWLTQRKGPNRVGPWGTLQTLADGVKLLFKEDIMTTGQDKLLFTIAPAIFFLPVFVIYALIPFTQEMQGIAIPAAALLIFALSSISVIGMVLSGWASNNKYSLLGGMRSAAQAISYEIPLVMAVLAVVLYTGSMDMNTLVKGQQCQFYLEAMRVSCDASPIVGLSGKSIPLGFLSWFAIWLTPVSCFIFLISSIAEVNRIPFDLPEAESELVSGYNTEYSGMKFALFFLAEYASLFAMSALMVIFFFGGYNSPIGGLLVDQLKLVKWADAQLVGLGGLLRQFEMINWMILKTYIFIFLAMWLRGTLPRLKPDQLMGFSWKFLIPLSLINIFMVALWKMAYDTHLVIYYILTAVVLVFGLGGFTVFMSQLFNKQLEARIAKS